MNKRFRVSFDALVPYRSLNLVGFVNILQAGLWKGFIEFSDWIFSAICTSVYEGYCWFHSICSPLAKELDFDSIVSSLVILWYALCLDC